MERLFGGLTYMFDDKSNRMKDDLLNAKLRIRMFIIFEHIHEYSGLLLKIIHINVIYKILFPAKSISEISFFFFT